LDNLCKAQPIPISTLFIDLGSFVETKVHETLTNQILIFKIIDKLDEIKTATVRDPYSATF